MNIYWEKFVRKLGVFRDKKVALIKEIKAEASQTIMNKNSNDPEVIKELKTAENKIADIIISSISVDKPKLNKPSRETKENVATFIEMLQRSIEEKQQCIEKDTSYKIKLLDIHPMSEFYKPYIAELNEKIENIIKELKTELVRPITLFGI